MLANPPRPTKNGDGKVAEKSVSKVRSPRSDMRDRIQSQMLDYPGLKNHDEVIAKKCDAARERMRATEAEYWEWHRKMTSTVGPRWSMPGDQYKGKRPAEEEILEKVEKAQAEMADTAAKYKAWVKEMENNRQEQLQKNVADRARELKRYAAEAKANMATRDAAVNEDREKRAQQAGMYWTWLAERKAAIQKREVKNAPFTRSSGVKSVEELTQMKKAELAQEIAERESQYGQWLLGIKKAKNKVPWNKECNTVEQRDAIINANAKKGIEVLKARTAEHNKWVKEIEQKHHERTMEKVRAKLEADKEFARNRENAAAGLREKMAEAKKQQQIIAQQSQREVKEMYERVQSKPLLVEQAYRFGKFV